MEYIVTTCILVALVVVFETRDGKKRTENLKALHEMKRGTIMVVNMPQKRPLRKHTIAMLLVFMSIDASANPYFRLMNLDSPRRVSIGAFADPRGNDTPDSGAMLAIVTHSVKDGSIIQSLQCDWTPLAVGGGNNGGESFLAIGPSANLAPAVKSLILRGLDWASPVGFANVRQLLAPIPGNRPDINIAFGPAWVLKPIDGGSLKEPSDWKGYFRFFVGANWAF